MWENGGPRARPACCSSARSRWTRIGSIASSASAPARRSPGRSDPSVIDAAMTSSEVDLVLLDGQQSWVESRIRHAANDNLQSAPAGRARRRGARAPPRTSFGRPPTTSSVRRSTDRSFALGFTRSCAGSAPRSAGKRRSVPVRMRRAERKLLEYLRACPGRVVTQNEILDNVFGGLRASGHLAGAGPRLAPAPASGRARRRSARSGAPGTCSRSTSAQSVDERRLATDRPAERRSAGAPGTRRSRAAPRRGRASPRRRTAPPAARRSVARRAFHASGTLIAGWPVTFASGVNGMNENTRRTDASTTPGSRSRNPRCAATQHLVRERLEPARVQRADRRRRGPERR